MTTFTVEDVSWTGGHYNRRVLTMAELFAFADTWGYEARRKDGTAFVTNLYRGGELRAVCTENY